MKNVFHHIFNTWRHHVKLQIATVIVLTSSFVVISGVLTLSSNMLRVLTLWGESMQVSVYLKDEVSDENRAVIENYLRENQNVEKPKLVTKSDALQLFQEQMASYAPDILKDRDLIKFIPSSFQFAVSKAVPVQDQLSVMRDLATQLRVMAGVEDVSYGQEWVKSYSSVTTALTWAGTIFVLIVLSAAAFVMANSFHSSIHQRRHEIEVLELIGATASYIRRPFVWEGAFLGGICSIAALVVSYGLFLIAKDYFSNQIAFLQLSAHIQFLNSTIVLAVIGFGALIGAIASWLCVRNINSGWAAIE